MPIDFTQLYTGMGAKTAARTAGASPQANSALAQLRLTPGEAVSAEVLNVKSIKPEHQQWLSREQPASLPPANTRPGDARAALRLATLLIKGQSLPVITREALQPGQQVAVALTSNRQLSLRPETSAATPRPESTGNNRPAVAAEVLNQALREILPRQAGPSVEPLAAALARVLQKLPQPPGTQPLTQSLQQLAKAPVALRPGVPLEPVQLKSALEQSGSLFERHLANAKSKGPEAVQQVISTDRKATLLHLAKQVTAQLPAAAQATAPGLKIPATQAALRPREAADVAAIVRLLSAGSNAQGVNSHGAQAQLSSPVSPTAVNPAQGKTPAGSLPAGMDSLSIKGGELNLSQLLLNSQHIPRETSESRALRTQLLLLTHQLTLNSLARIRQQQLQPEASRARTGEAAPGINVHFELPIRLDQGVYPAKIAIQEQPEPGEEKPSAQKGKRWQVTLALQTPEAGDIYARLAYINASLDIVIWGENQQLLKQAKTKFSDYLKPMAAAGLEVNSVQFREGVPTAEGNTLAYNLVDIST
ncbi:hypothetical protein [Gilvimarinus sp. DA14]|uniref:hypothetical protein n=1 Tax=Gilvimarinus sp. DA14 TaxID=2956798 RepID=UPI0020B86A4B|nr:hypothetical protein [Gilvimarinus sp. DA14]UTF60699.1 hypothetical protein NHM04_02550 [Gilvimarinus sp. DA14]